MNDLLTAREAAARIRPLVPRSHKELILRTAAHHRALITDFHRTAWEVIEALDVTAYLAEYDLDYAWFKRVMPLKPDAYKLDMFRRKMVIYEVEVTSRLTPRKLEIIASFSVHMNILGWYFALIRVDEFGRYRHEPLEPFIAAYVRK